ncbi:MAG: tripartite tricarboxylate transporter substrate binding protein [Pseudomonadota bacterium]|nr:tripartite tricarboxylate transporter substrate binding protein [Pseudomonadota bacterium]
MKSLWTALALAAIALSPTAPAQAAWPDKPIHFVVPYPPGGNVDSAARIVSDRLGAALGQTFIVENKPGAGGMIAAEYVAKAPADGYTFFMGANGPILFSPTIFKKNLYDWKKDFIPIGSVSFTALVVQVSPSTPYKTFAELIAAGKKPDNRLTMASPGAGTTNHLVSEYLQRESGAHWLTVHYKGNAPATTDLLGGHVQFDLDQISVALPFIKEGKTRPLAVTSDKRLPQLPDVPTLQELGFKGFEALTFTGILAPAGTPADIIERFSAALKKVLAEKGVQDKFLGLGAEARFETPEQFRKYLAAEDARWIPVIKESHISAE